MSEFNDENTDGNLSSHVFDKYSKSCVDYVIFSKIVKRAKSIVKSDVKLTMEVFRLKSTDDYRKEHDVIFENIFEDLDRLKSKKIQLLWQKVQNMNDLVFLNYLKNVRKNLKIK